MTNFFDNLPDALEAEVFETLIQSQHVTIERIISNGQHSPATGWYDQDRHEWVMVLQGSAVLAFDEGESVRLEAGSYINIPAHTKHKVAWTTPDTQTIWLAIHYD